MCPIAEGVEGRGGIRIGQCGIQRPGIDNIVGGRTESLLGMGRRRGDLPLAGAPFHAARDVRRSDASCRNLIAQIVAEVIGHRHRGADTQGMHEKRVGGGYDEVGTEAAAAASNASLTEECVRKQSHGVRELLTS